MTRRGRRPSYLRLSAADRRMLVRVLAVGLGAFAAGYLLIAILLFGDGPAEDVVTVPDLRDRTLPAAEQLLEREGLELALGDSFSNPSVPAGAVLAQTPLPGQEVAPGSAVRVLVSKGPARRPVPDVMRLRGPMAERALRAAGFEVVLEEDTSRLPAGRVVEVDPAPGTAVTLPARVRLRVSVGPPRSEVPSLVGLQEAEARERLEDEGLAMAVEHGYYWRGEPGEVLAQTPSAGDSLPQGDTVKVTVLTDRLRGSPPDDRSP